MDSESWKLLRSVCILSFLLGSFSVYQSLHAVVAAQEQQDTQPAVTLQVNASNVAGRLIPDTLFGIFFEEINHAGAGGLWAELVSNRGFEAGGQNTPSNIWPWSIVGDQSSVYVATDRSSPFERNKIALRMDVICDGNGCPSGGVGVYNPGYWGMNIEEGMKYKVAFYVRSSDDIDLSVSLTSSNGSLTLASEKIIASASDVSKWTKKEVLLEAKGTDHGARLQLTTTKKGSLWIDQVSAMPVDTYKFIHSLLLWIFVELGGCFVEGEWLSNAFRWKETVGPWEERPGHFGDVWKYWTDDGLGHFEFFQIYTSASSLFSMYHQFDGTSRKGPKAFVSEYAVTGKDAGTGSLLAALAEAAFLIGLEKNSDIVEMASYAPLFVNTNDRRWNPDAIVFNSSHLYGTPSFWVQRFFAESSGSTLLSSELKGNSSSIVASAISWKNSSQDYIRIKAVNFGDSSVNLKVLVTGLDPNVMKVSGSTRTVLTSTNVMDENSFTQPEKVVPQESLLEMAEEDLTVVLPPHSFSSFDLLKEPAKIRKPVSDSSYQKTSTM
uniref:non-reducing end alpha-L-arabinofuranosidase n=1 Tax=Brassica campestris TaxID=3711 RepID=M4CAZ7_BRACM